MKNTLLGWGSGFFPSNIKNLLSIKALSQLQYEERYLETVRAPCLFNLPHFPYLWIFPPTPSFVIRVGAKVHVFIEGSGYSSPLFIEKGLGCRVLKVRVLRMGPARTGVPR